MLKIGSKNAIINMNINWTVLFFSLKIKVNPVYTKMKRHKMNRCLMEKAGVANRGGTALIKEKKYANPSMLITILQSGI